MDKMRHRTHEVFFKRIVFRFEVVHFGNVRDHLLPNGVALFFDRRHHRGSNAHWIVAYDGFDFFLIDTEPVRQVFWLHNAVGEYASPSFHAVSFIVEGSAGLLRDAKKVAYPPNPGGYFAHLTPSLPR